jgi:hypothetical protein
MQRKWIAALLTGVLALGAVGPSQADEHLVMAAARDAQLRDQADKRAHEIATLEDLLDGFGHLERVKPAVRLLSDDELESLAARAEALKMDPAAGMGTAASSLAALLVIGLVAFVVFVAVAFHDYHD